MSAQPLDQLLGRLDGKVALVTGNAGGIGLETAKLLHAAGATVVGADLGARPDELDGVVDPVDHHRIDVSDPAAIDALVADVVARHGAIDIVHGNAGINVPGRLHNLSVEDYRRVMGVCCDANAFLVRAAVPHMRERGGGAFVFTSSICGIAATPRSPVYNMAKHAMIGLAQTVAADYGREGIRAVALVAGPTRTPMGDRLWPEGSPVREAFVRTTAVGRLAEAREQARAVLFAVLPGSEYITGCTITVDGGATGGWNEMGHGMYAAPAVSA
jgi:meso-butanediol dehydrogenase/(S,S)-butanediol dehydrogenase/diacetyl reductase